jgi:hypothetical protein
MDIVPGDELQDADLVNAMLIHESVTLEEDAVHNGVEDCTDDEGLRNKSE